MRSRNGRWVGRVGLVVGLALVAACSVKRVPGPGDPTRSAPPAPYDFQGEAKSPPPPAVQPAPAGANEPVPTLETPEPVRLDAPPVEVQDLPAAAPPAAAPAPAVAAAGFRVQVFASPDEAAAARVRAEITAKLGDAAYVDFEPPYYKVRVGNCASSDACRSLQDRLRTAGYDTVWIVPAEIEP